MTPGTSLAMPRILRALTWLDFAVCAALALPLVSLLFLQALSAFSVALGFEAIDMPSDSALFFVSLAGLFGVLWNLALLHQGTAALHRLDLAGRAGVVLLIAIHMLRTGLSPVFGAFIATEVWGGFLKARWLSIKTPAD